jgi:hypothetical protein
MREYKGNHGEAGGMKGEVRWEERREKMQVGWEKDREAGGKKWGSSAERGRKGERRYR